MSRDNRYGQLGDGTATGSSVPVVVLGLADAVSIVVGDYHSCAVITDGTARCWGANVDGQLGNGFSAVSLLPLEVIGL